MELYLGKCFKTDGVWLIDLETSQNGECVLQYLTPSPPPTADRLGVLGSGCLLPPAIPLDLGIFRGLPLSHPTITDFLGELGHRNNISS